MRNGKPKVFIAPGEICPFCEDIGLLRMVACNSELENWNKHNPSHVCDCDDKAVLP